MKQILVTGAGGFIGSHLVPALAREGYLVTAVDIRQEALQKFEGMSHVLRQLIDMRDHRQTETLEEYGFDAIVHLAALAAPRIAESQPEETFKTNVLGTYNILKLAKKANVKRVLFSSSAHVYGISPKYLPTDEVHPLWLQDTYTSSKIIGEQLCQLFYDNHDIPYVTLRLFNVYGPGQTADYFVPAMIEQAKKGSIMLRGRYVTKDFVYIDDVVDAMMKALESDYVGWLNVGTGRQIALEYAASVIAKQFNAPLTFAETEDKGPTNMQCDNTRIKKILGWQPKISIDEGLLKTTNAMR